MVEIQQLPELPTLLEGLGRFLIGLLFLVGYLLAVILVPEEVGTIVTCINAVLTPNPPTS